MKKYLLTLALISMPAFAYAPPSASVMQVHDLEMVKQQQFRMHELNYYNEVQEEKARYQKRNKQPQTVIQETFPEKSKFTDDNGEIKIKYDGN